VRLANCSLLISTYNWPQALNLALKSALFQTRLPSEILLADDGSKEETRQLIDRFKQISPVPIHHFWQEDIGFRKSQILNKALAKCSSEYVIQIDGDCIMHPYFVQDHMASAQKGVYLFGPRVDILPDHVADVLANQQTEFNVYSKKIKNKTRNLHIPFISNFYRPKKGFSDRFRGCNASFWYQDLLAINGYNEDYEGWGREDSDLVIRMGNGGVKAKRLKYAGIVYHIDHPINSRDRFDLNDKLHNDVITKGTVRIANGMDKYLDGPGQPSPGA